MAGIAPREAAGGTTGALHTVAVRAMRWLTEETFEIRFERPDHFDYLPGQKISFVDGAHRRDYTLLGPVEADELALCVRLVANGRFSPRLARASSGDRFRITVPFGFFTYKASSRPAVFVATGTGIAPFVAFTRAGIRGFDLLHGGRTASELYYQEILTGSARSYIPCISGASGGESLAAAFAGRVDQYLTTVFPEGVYDFYLCGRSEMIRDVTRVIDLRFPDSRLFMEAFD